MPRLRSAEIDNLEDLDTLEQADYDDSERGGRYEGDDPPSGAILNGYIKRMWFKYTDPDSGKQTAGKPMLITMFVADGNVGSLAEYDGWATWDYLVIAEVTKFRWAPFCQAIGLSIKYVMDWLEYEEEEDGNNGNPINWIGPKNKPKFVPGEDEDTAYLRVLIRQEKDKRPKSEGGTGEMRARINKYLEWDEPQAPDDDEDLDDTEVEEDEAPPPRKRAAATSSARTSARRKAAEPEPDEEDEPEEDEPEEDEPEEEEAPAKPARRARTARTAPAAAKAPAAKAPARASRTARTAPASAKPAARRSRTGSTEEPPF